MEDSGTKNDEVALPLGPRSIVIGKSEIVILPNVGRVPRKSIRNAYVRNQPNDPRIILELTWLRRSIWIRVDTAEQGDELVEALGFPSRRHRQQFFGAPGGGRLAVLLFGLAVGVPAAFAGVVRMEVALVGTLMLYALASFLLYASRSWITVTREGVTFHQMLARKRVSFAEIESIERKGTVIVFHVKGGPTRLFLADDDTLLEILDHVQRAFASFVQAHPPSTLGDLLERNGRTNEAWLRDLRALRDGRYRVAAVDEAELKKIVSDGANPAPLRLAAEIVLSDETDEDANERRLAEIEALERDDA